MNYFTNKNSIYAFYIIFIVGVIGFGIIKPALNWDIIGYVASSLHFEYSNIHELHKMVFGGLQQFVSPEEYLHLTNVNSNYRATMATNPVLFAQQLPFYEIRPIYNGLIYFLYKLGINIFAATYYVSIFSAVISIVVLFKTFFKKISNELLYIIPIALMTFGILSVSRLSTPDSLVLMGLSFFVNFYVNSKEKSIFVLLPILVLLRTDLIIFSLLYLFYYLYENKKNYMQVILSCLISLIFYFAINKIVGNYGWSTVFYITLIERINNPAEITLVVSFKDYIIAFIKGLITGLNDYTFLSYLVLLLINIFFVVKLASVLHNIKIIKFFVLISVVYIIAHYILFPVLWYRFFIGFYLFNFIGTILIIDDLIKKYENSIL